MYKKFSLVVVLLMVVSLVLTACSPAAEPAVDNQEPAAEEAAAEEPAEEAATSGDRVQIRWFVGLGAGSDEPTFAPQQAFVEEFNASQDRIELVIEIVDADSAQDTLATQIAAGNAPDIAGPVGIKGRDGFKGAWLDLTDLIEENNYDLTAFDPALVKFNEVKEEGQLGIPFAIYPSFVLYNKDLFDEAGLPYPPSEYGQPYVDENGVEKEWNMDTLRELAMKLSVDANGNDATMEEYDVENIVQFGWMNQWTDARGIGTMFGAGNFVADDGVTAQIPDAWKAAWQWTYDGYWTDYFIPNGPYGGADFLQGPGGPFSSGNLAMMHNHMWYVAPWALADVPFEWDLAATPSYNGQVTSKMHADTFGILKASEHPEEAFEVLTYMLSEEGASKLLNIYGGMPARLSMQDDYFEKYGETNFPGAEITWDVVPASMAYADNPNHEAWMPSYQETVDRYNEFWTNLTNNAGLDLEAEMEVLLVDLQKIFDAAQ